VPRGEKVPDALLKIGLCQKDLGDGAGAKRSWERVVREHPQSAAARQARALLRN
jgi:TolA-binding protein